MAEGDEFRLLADEQLLARSAALDPEAFAAFYDRHASAAMALATKMVGADRAGEMVRLAFEGIWRNSAHFGAPPGGVRSWLLETVRRRCVEELRGLDSDERRRIAERSESTPLGRAGGTSEAAQSALASLTAEQRRVIELIFFGGWSRTEVAAQLQLSEKAVTDLIAEAFETMSNDLESKGADGE